MVMSGTGPGQGVTGFIANASNPFDPATDPYPTSNPTAGFTPKDEGFAGIIHGRRQPAAPELSLYCIDIDTITKIGIGYVLGTWNAANVPNVGYVARLLAEYYPNTDEPAAPDRSQPEGRRGAGGHLVLQRPLRAEHLGPVAQRRGRDRGQDPSRGAAGPAATAQPHASPRRRERPRRQRGRTVHGQHHATAARARATVTATGGNMFSDAAGTVPIANGAAVPTARRSGCGPRVPPPWCSRPPRRRPCPPATSTSTTATRRSHDAQKLILAKTATLKTTVQATAEFLAPGSLVVKKTIAGPAAGSQARVVIHTVCDDGVALTPDFVIPAGTPAGDKSKTYEPIPAGSLCTVTETSDGSVVGTDVVVIGAGQEATIPSGESETVHITDTYDFVGSLLVQEDDRRSGCGPARGDQDPHGVRWQGLDPGLRDSRRDSRG